MSHEQETNTGRGCIDADQALRLIEGDLRGDEREECLLHIDECTACREYISDLTRVMLHESTTGIRSSAPGDDLELDGSQVIGGTYRLGQIIGTGAMGVVYEASHERLPRTFAVKLLRRGDEDARKRFRREAQIASDLDHRNVARVVDFGTTHNGHPYLVMDRLEGENLSARIARLGKLDAAAALDIGEQIAAALDAAHERGVVHRDVKPSNIFLSLESDRTEVVKLLDFGVSKASDAMTRTRRDTLVGTPLYMSPEQARGASDVDRRADVFSLAAVIYHMLAGRPPFDGDSVEAVLYQLVHERPSPVMRFNPAVPSALDSALQRGMSKRAEERYPSAGELIRRCRAPSHETWRRLVFGGVTTVGLAVLVLAAEWRTGRAPDELEHNATSIGIASTAPLESIAPTLEGSLSPRGTSSSAAAGAASATRSKRSVRHITAVSTPASGDGFDRLISAGAIRNAANEKVVNKNPACMTDLERARQLDPEHDASFVYLRAQCLAVSGRCPEATAIARRYFGGYMSGDALDAQIAIFGQMHCSP